MQLSKNTKISQVVDATAGAAGTTDIEGDSVDMSGFEGVLFIVMMGAITTNAVTSVKAQQSSDDGSTDAFADLAGTAQTVADDDDGQVFYIDVYRPRERYVRPVIDRGTQNAVVQSVLAVQYGPRVAPTTHGTGVNGEAHVSPAEGTA